MIATVRRAFSSPWGLAGGLFLLALVPRALSLGSYVTHDEPFWLLSSIRCIYGLGHGDLTAAFQSAHPGVPSLIGHGSLLWLYYALTGRPDVIPTIAESGWVIFFPPHWYHLLPEMIAVAGLFTAAVSALSVAGAYLLTRRLLGPTVALFAGLLLALDPYFLALSRVVGVDAVLSGFMLLSLLSLLIYLQEPSRFLFLLGAGVFAALAVLTKTSAGFLLPFTLLTLLAFAIHRLLASRRDRRSEWRWLVMVLLWAGGTALAFLCLWPAAWQDPAGTLTRLIDNVRAVITIPHESASYFLGQVVADPGWLYYWVVLLFRLTPLTLPLGLLAVAFLPIDALRRRWRADTTSMLLLFLYAALYLAMMSLAAKKQERYILPAVLAIDVLAAWALVRFLGWLSKVRWIRSSTVQLRWVAVGLVLIVSLWWFRLHPHYYAYQNPLVGGSPAADWVYMTGWGEGNELAAAYLNQHPDAADLVTAASFDAGVGALVPGVTLWLSPQTLQLADYAVLYEGLTRRDVPSAEVVDPFAGRQPVHTVFLDGIPYVRVYALTPAGTPRRLLSWQLPATQHPGSTAVGKNVAFRGYDGDLTASAGDTLALTLYWSCVNSLSRDYTVFVHLIDPRTSQQWGQWDSPPLNGRFPTSWWLPGLVIRDHVALTVDPATPPGEYELRVGMYDVQTGKRLWVGEKGSGRDSIVLGPVIVTRGVP